MKVRELTSEEILEVNGGNPAAFIGGAIVGGLLYDGAKAAAMWFGENFLARDGSGGSRYPIGELGAR